MWILIYALQDIVRELDIRLFLRVSPKTLKHRRDERNGYRMNPPEVLVAL